MSPGGPRLGSPHTRAFPWSFGAVAVGDSTPRVALRAVNKLGYSMTITSLELDDPSFVVADDGCTGVLLPDGGACTIGVVFSPGSAGPAKALVRIVARHDCTSEAYFPCDDEYRDEGKNFTVTDLPGGTRRVEWRSRLGGTEANSLTGIGVA